MELGNSPHSKRAQHPGMTELQSWSTNASLHSSERLQEVGEATDLVLERTLGKGSGWRWRIIIGGKGNEVVATKEVFVLPENDAMKSSQCSEAVRLFRVDHGIKNRCKVKRK